MHNGPPNLWTNSAKGGGKVGGPSVVDRQSEARNGRFGLEPHATQMLLLLGVADTVPLGTTPLGDRGTVRFLPPLRAFAMLGLGLRAEQLPNGPSRFLQMERIIAVEPLRIQAEFKAVRSNGVGIGCLVLPSYWFSGRLRSRVGDGPWRRGTAVPQGRPAPPGGELRAG